MAKLASKILIIDDSPVILEAARGTLEDEGYVVITLDNPLSVAAVVRKEHPDLVLIDVNMPTLNGDVVVRIVRASGVTGSTKVVLYSDIDVRELALRASRCGASGFIAKTGDQVAFAREVAAFLKGGSPEVVRPV